jgi:hypothetical protein
LAYLSIHYNVFKRNELPLFNHSRETSTIGTTCFPNQFLKIVPLRVALASYPCSIEWEFGRVVTKSSHTTYDSLATSSTLSLPIIFSKIRGALGKSKLVGGNL